MCVCVFLSPKIFFQNIRANSVTMWEPSSRLIRKI